MRPRELPYNVSTSSICGWANDMRIRRIEIENFKKLVGPVVIDNIGEGITVIAGDNEEGKSTILQALRSVLFDRHNLTGDAAEAMQPFGHRVRPEIALEFEIDGKTYRLAKGFCQRPSAELKTPTGIPRGVAGGGREASKSFCGSIRRGKVKASLTTIMVFADYSGSNRAGIQTNLPQRRQSRRTYGRT